jgi:hypothetical protein
MACHAQLHSTLHREMHAALVYSFFVPIEFSRQAMSSRSLLFAQLCLQVSSCMQVGILGVVAAPLSVLFSILLFKFEPETLDLKNITIILAWVSLGYSAALLWVFVITQRVKRLLLPTDTPCLH